MKLRKFHKALTIVAIVLFSFTLAACGGEGENNGDQENENENQGAVESTHYYAAWNQKELKETSGLQQPDKLEAIIARLKDRA